MSKPATEVCILPVPPGTNLEDPSSVAGGILKSCLDTVAEQEGYQRAYYGQQVEAGNMVQLLIDWDSVDAHKKFMADPSYGPFLKRFASALDGKATIFHVNLDPHPPAPAVSHTFSPVTECFTSFFDPSISESEQADYDAVVRKLLKDSADSQGRPKALAAGWIMEEIEKTEGEGKTKAHIAFIGWESVDDHMAAKEAPQWKENITKVREAPKVKGFEVHHVKFQES